MAKVKAKVPRVSSVKYGARNREKVGALVEQYKPKNMRCPFTGKKGKVKRIAAGIFISTATGEKFTAKAYSPEVTKKATEE
jgi:ribosomal protein L37AE/L43A